MPEGKGRVPPTGLGGPVARGRLWPLGGLPVALWSLASSWRIKIPRNFWRNFENISRSGFSEIENSKNRKLALGILSVSPIKMPKNDIIT